MRKLLGVLFTSSVCVVLGLSTTGCTDKSKDKAVSVKSGAPKEKVDRKDDTFTITFEHGKTSADVTVEPKDKGVKAEKKGDTEIVVTITAKDIPDAKTEYTISTKAKGDAGKKEEKAFSWKFTIDAKAPAGGTDEKKDVALESAKLEIALVKDAEATGKVKITAGKADIDSIAPKEKGVTAKVDGEWVKVMVAKDTEPGDFVIKLKSTEEKKKGADLTVKVVPIKKVEAGTDPVDLEVDTKNVPDKLPTFDKAKADKNVVTIMFSKGKVLEAKVVAPEKDSGVEVTGEKDWVKITVTEKPVAETIKIKVKAVGDKKGIEIEIKKGVITYTGVSFLNDRNDDRFNEPRVLAVIYQQFVALTRRM